jgi:DNA invertase Pin-like site-specific DNA recombinase
MENKTFVYGYTRVSSSSQAGDESLSLVAQEAMIRTAASSTVLIMDVTSEVGSGWRCKQPKLEALMRRVLSNRKIDVNTNNSYVIAVAAVSRFSRQAAWAIGKIADLWKHGVDVISCSETARYSTHRGMWFQLLHGAEVESETLSRRALMRSEFVKANGGFLGSTPPFGYRVEKRDVGGGAAAGPSYMRVLVPDENEQRTLHVLNKVTERVFQDPQFRGCIYPTIAWEMNSGVAGLEYRGEDWTVSRVRSAMLSERVAVDFEPYVATRDDGWILDAGNVAIGWYDRGVPSPLTIAQQVMFGFEKTPFRVADSVELATYPRLDAPRDHGMDVDDESEEEVAPMPVASNPLGINLDAMTPDQLVVLMRALTTRWIEATSK